MKVIYKINGSVSNNIKNEQIKKDNIQRALEEGLDTLLHDEVQEIRMPNIAEKIGISSRSMTRYFRTKDNFVCAILEKMNHDDLKSARLYAKESHMEELSGI